MVTKQAKLTRVSVKMKVIVVKSWRRLEIILQLCSQLTAVKKCSHIHTYSKKVLRLRLNGYFSTELDFSLDNSSTTRLKTSYMMLV